MRRRHPWPMLGARRAARRADRRGARCHPGQTANARFAGRLPYLFKILDVCKMLSIQAHPTLAQARSGFARENAEGIGLEASRRNYKDDNHKPEIGVALTEFWMLHGFRPLEQIAERFSQTPELGALMPGFTQRLDEAGHHDHGFAADCCANSIARS